jgi:hypothetical protein
MSNAREAADSDAMVALARFGLAARAFIYLVIGLIAVQIAQGHGSHAADQRGALTLIAGHAYGDALLWVLAVGFACYALWRLSDAAFGTATDGRKAGPRLKSLWRALVYAFFSVSTFVFILSAPAQTQGEEQKSLTARFMSNGAGRWLVAIVGAIVVVVGLGMVIEGVTRRFTKQLQLDALEPGLRRLVIALGVVGTVARGIVFAVAGGLTVQAAATFDARQPEGWMARSERWPTARTGRGCWSWWRPGWSYSASTDSPRPGGARSKARIEGWTGSISRRCGRTFRRWAAGSHSSTARAVRRCPMWLPMPSARRWWRRWPIVGW